MPRASRKTLPTSCQWFGVILGAVLYCLSPLLQNYWRSFGYLRADLFFSAFSLLFLSKFCLLACLLACVLACLLVGACDRSEAERGRCVVEATPQARPEDHFASISVLLLWLQATWDLLCRTARTISLSVSWLLRLARGYGDKVVRFLLVVGLSSEKKSIVGVLVRNRVLFSFACLSGWPYPRSACAGAVETLVDDFRAGLGQREGLGYTVVCRSMFHDSLFMIISKRCVNMFCSMFTVNQSFYFTADTRSNDHDCQIWWKVTAYFAFHGPPFCPSSSQPLFDSFLRYFRPASPTKLYAIQKTISFLACLY